MRRRPEVFWRRAGRGPALVLLNGWSASGLAWPRAWVRDLEASFTVVRIDNRGSGFSRFAQAPFTIEDLADDVAEVLDAEDLDRAVVLGLSMGGMIAQEFTLRHPERVDGLVLIGTRPPAPLYALPESSTTLLPLMGSPRKGEDLATFFLRIWSMATGEGFADTHPEAMAELVGQILERPTSRQSLMTQLRAVTGWGHAERLATITAPTIVIHGEQDTFVDVRNGRRLGEAIPGARYVELAGVGHLPPLEVPDEVLGLILGLRPDAAQRPAA